MCVCVCVDGWIYFKAKRLRRITVSIPYSLRMICVAFHNVVVSALFNYLRMWSLHILLFN
jgi:hypothetical protein